jgi:hypothetical protein
MMRKKKMIRRSRETWIKATHSIWTRTDFLEYVFVFCFSVWIVCPFTAHTAPGGGALGAGRRPERWMWNPAAAARARTHTHTNIRAQRAGSAARVQSQGAAPLPAHCKGSVRGNTACVLLLECVLFIADHYMKIIIRKSLYARVTDCFAVEKQKNLPCPQLEKLEPHRQKEQVHSESQRLGARVFAVFSSVFSSQELDARTRGP